MSNYLNFEHRTSFGGGYYLQLPKIQQMYNSQFTFPNINYSQNSKVIQSKDPESELLARRKRNAGASARFRDRRKQRETMMQEKCKFLERRVKELEEMDSFKRISELEKNLIKVTNERENLEREVKLISLIISLFTKRGLLTQIFF